MWLFRLSRWEGWISWRNRWTQGLLGKGPWSAGIETCRCWPGSVPRGRGTGVARAGGQCQNDTGVFKGSCENGDRSLDIDRIRKRGSFYIVLVVTMLILMVNYCTMWEQTRISHHDQQRRRGQVPEGLGKLPTTIGAANDELAVLYCRRTLRNEFKEVYLTN